jgi:tRNA (uracil-5-)-methyltransferase
MAQERKGKKEQTAHEIAFHPTKKAQDKSVRRMPKKKTATLQPSAHTAAIAAMEGDKTPPQPQPELAGEKRKREEEGLKAAAATEDAPTAPAASGEDAAGGGGGRHPMWKTSLCSYFRRSGSGAQGCSHGESCRYAHTEEELRPRPDGTWDPTSDRAKKLRKVAAEAREEAEEEEVTVDEQSLDKCLVGLPRGWTADRLKSFLQDQASTVDDSFIVYHRSRTHMQECSAASFLQRN